MADYTGDPYNPGRRVWRCPCCRGLNVWCWDDAETVARLTGRPLLQYANDSSRETVGVASGGCFDNICSHCGADLVRTDSPLMAECYTHTNPEDYSDAD